MKPRTVRKWDRAAAYIAWVSILLLGLGMLAVGLDLGPVRIGSFLWGGGVLVLVTIFGLVFNVRQDLEGHRAGPSA